MKKHIIVFLLAAIAAFPVLAQTELRLEPSGDTGENDLFGGTVASSGSTMVISGQGADSTTIPDSGAVFVFDRQGNSWVQTARLMASDARFEDDFGDNVGISEDGNTIVVAADGANANVAPFFNRAGVVYVFERANGVWSQAAELTSPTQARNAGFGFWGLAISGNRIAVGDPGGFANGFTPVVDVFTRTDSGWTQTATIGVPDDFEFFPQAISISGNTLVVTALNSSVSINGAAYVFALQDGTWVRQATLTVDENFFFFGVFGTSVSIRGDLIAIGSAFASGATPESGAVYVFARRDNSWTQAAKLAPANGADGDSFGFSVSVFGNTVAVGAPGHNAKGSVYLYRAQAGGFVQVSEVAASDGVPGGIFGGAVALHDDTLLVGAMGQHPQVDNGQGYPGGEAYVDQVNP